MLHHGTTSRQRRSPANLMRILAIAVAVLLTSGLVLQRSESAFSSKTDYSGNTLGVGSVTLTDNDAGNTYFNLTAMKPGDSQTKCVLVTYSGTIDPAANVVMYGSYGVSNTAAQYLDLTLKVGPSGQTCTWDGTAPAATASYANTLKSFTDAYSLYSPSWDTGWRPTSSSDKVRPVMITLTLPSNAPDGAQGTSANPVFTWEVRSS